MNQPPNAPRVSPAVGTESENQRLVEIANGGGGLAWMARCALDARQQITTLQQELGEAHAEAAMPESAWKGLYKNMRQMHEARHAELRQLTTERDTAQAQVSVLREALAATWPGIAEEEGFINPGGNITMTHRLAKIALHDTQQAAEEHTARVAELQSVIDWMDEQIRIKNISWVGVPYDIATNGAIAREAVAKRQEEHTARVRREALREAEARDEHIAKLNAHLHRTMEYWNSRPAIIGDRYEAQKSAERAIERAAIEAERVALLAASPKRIEALAAASETGEG